MGTSSGNAVGQISLAGVDQPKYRFAPSLEEHVREIVRKEMSAFLKTEEGKEVLDEAVTQAMCESR